MSPALQPNSYATELSEDTAWDTRAAENGKLHQDMERTMWGMTKDRAVIWELKTEKEKTHLWQETGESTAHDHQRKQPLQTARKTEKTA